MILVSKNDVEMVLILTGIGGASGALFLGAIYGIVTVARFAWGN